MKHRILALALTVCLCLAFTPPAFAQWTPPEDAPEAAAVYLENLDTGTVIYERNADEQRPIASLTKMMTCLLLAESGLDLDETFAVPEALSPEFARIRSENGAYIDLQPGEEVTLRDLAYCTMLPSTNDSASTIAWRVAGSLDDFVAQMNQRAAQLGCTDTRYSCPHGLYDVGNYSTAHDLARIAEACMNNDVLRTICTTQEWWLPLDNVHQTVLTPDAPAGKYLRIGTSIQLQNPDSPFYRPWAEGVKTGFTDAAGRCVVTTANTDTGRYLLVLLGEPNHKLENGSQQIYQDAAALLDWAVDAFSIGSAPDTEQPACAGARRAARPFSTRPPHWTACFCAAIRRTRWKPWICRNSWRPRWPPASRSGRSTSYRTARCWALFRWRCGRTTPAAAACITATGWPLTGAGCAPPGRCLRLCCC